MSIERSVAFAAGLETADEFAVPIAAVDPGPPRARLPVAGIVALVVGLAGLGLLPATPEQEPRFDGGQDSAFVRSADVSPVATASPHATPWPVATRGPRNDPDARGGRWAIVP